MAVKHVVLQHGRSLQHCTLLSMYCLGRAIIEYFFIAKYFPTNFPPLWSSNILFLLCQLVVSFISVTVSRHDRSADSGVGLYCIQGIH
jgi:hypothetical protein